MKKAILTLAVTAALGLQGCSVFSLGESEYSCSGIPDKTACMSAREAYMLTNNGNVPRSKEGGETSNQSAVSGADSDAEVVRQVIVDDYVAPSTPNDNVPIRSEAKVMRIWVAPWQDASGDLHISSYVYTEIEPRKWLFENEGKARSVHLEPLQAMPAPANTDGNQRSPASMPTPQ